MPFTCTYGRYSSSCSGGYWVDDAVISQERYPCGPNRATFPTRADLDDRGFIGLRHKKEPGRSTPGEQRGNALQAVALAYWLELKCSSRNRCDHLLKLSMADGPIGNCPSVKFAGYSPSRRSVIYVREGRIDTSAPSSARHPGSRQPLGRDTSGPSPPPRAGQCRRGNTVSTRWMWSRNSCM